jgi:hypothetical protein
MEQEKRVDGTPPVVAVVQKWLNRVTVVLAIMVLVVGIGLVWSRIISVEQEPWSARTSLDKNADSRSGVSLFEYGYTYKVKVRWKRMILINDSGDPQSCPKEEKDPATPISSVDERRVTGISTDL